MSHFYGKKACNSLAGMLEYFARYYILAANPHEKEVKDK